MKYVIVYGSVKGQAIGSLEKYDSRSKAELELKKLIQGNNKEWKLYWIQKEYIYENYY